MHDSLFQSALSNLVYSATPDVVNSTMIHGEMLMRDRELLHIDENAGKSQCDLLGSGTLPCRIAYKCS